MKKDRRRAKRLHPNLSIQMMVDCNAAAIGRIQDISAHGLSAEYEGICQFDVNHEIIVRIVSCVKGAEVIGDLRCIPVYDISTLDHDQSFRGKDMRRLGIVYCNCNRTHQARLNRLLASIA